MKRIFIIYSVRGASEEYKLKLEKYVDDLETTANGLASAYDVHLPHRDTNQNANGLEICRQNMEAIKKADEVHIFYNPDSQGTHFDMGVSFALGKKIVIIENVKYDPTKKSFARMLNEWQKY